MKKKKLDGVHKWICQYNNIGGIKNDWRMIVQFM